MLEMLLLLLIVAVVVFGIAVVVVNRRRSTPPERTRPTPAPPTPPPRSQPASTPEVATDSGDDSGAGVAVLEPVEEAEEAEAVEIEHLEVAVEPVRFRDRLTKARTAFAGALLGIRQRSGITAETWDDLEEALLRADVGVAVTDELLAGLRARVEAKEISDPDALVDALRTEMLGRLESADRNLHRVSTTPGEPDVWLFVGVNGVGKTTTIGKVSARQREEGVSVLLAAGDTFRAAAAEQLTTWAERSGAEIVRGSEGGDPSSVIFDAVERAASRSIDLVLADTAGRLQNKTNLMEELRKVRRVADKGRGTVSEVLLVIDATTGQNGLVQAQVFSEVTEVTGVVLTKLDGSAKGGIVFAIETQLGLPVKLVGLGETIEDLVPFDPEEFVAALVE
jgi:fused signal recognition particle receptor